MEDWARELLEKAEIVHLATLKEDGAPALRPVNFFYEEEKIYIHSGPKKRKIAQMARDPRVCIEIDQVFRYVPTAENPCAASYSYRSIVIEGLARMVEERERKRDILQKMVGKYQPGGGYRPISLEETDSVVVVEIEIRHFSAKEHIRG